MCYFRHTFPDVDLFEGDICNFTSPVLPSIESVVFGRPPCQEFSTSNQRTWNRIDSENWMFKEFFGILYLELRSGIHFA